MKNTPTAPAVPDDVIAAPWSVAELPGELAVCDAYGEPVASCDRELILNLEIVRERLRLAALAPELRQALLGAFALFRAEIEDEDGEISGADFLQEFLEWRATFAYLLDTLEGR